MPRTTEGDRKRPRRGSAVRDELPRVPVTSQKEMAFMLARHHRVLRDYARRYMPAAEDPDIEEVVDRVVDSLLGIEHPSLAHGLLYARRAVKRECDRWLVATATREGIPVDPLLHIPLTGRALKALQTMGPRSRSVIERVARGVAPGQIAADENTAPEVIYLRLHRARRRWLQLMSDAGQSTPAVILLLPRRLRANLMRLAEGFAPQSFATTALIPLLALFTSTGPAVVGPASAAARATTPNRVTQSDVLTAATAFAPIPPTPGHARVVTFATPGNSALPLAGHTAATETPDDVTLTAIATPADGRPVLVAIGRGNTCICSVLMESRNGGATWKATDGPPANVDQLAVPPTYPDDPRIFGGVSPVLGSAPYMTAAFGQPFVRLSTLPAGDVAVSAHFDDGDPRLFSAGETAVWSVRVAGTSPAAPAHDEVDYSGNAIAANVVAALATPSPSPDGPAILAWVPALATVPGSPGELAASPAVVQCRVASPCAVLSSVPASPWRLEVRGPVLVAYTHGPGTAYVSRDDGASFAALPLPKGAATVESIAIAGGDSMWVSFERTDGSVDVASLLGASGPWRDAAENSIGARTRLGVLIPVGTDRIIEQFATLGYRCTALSGQLWAARCPPQ